MYSDYCGHNVHLGYKESELLAFIKSATFFFNNTKRYLILNLSNSSSLTLKPSVMRLSYPITPLKLIVNDTKDLPIAKSKGLFWLLLFLDL